MYTCALEANSIAPLNSGFAINNNNDHILTFHGLLLGISHHNQNDGGDSALYYFPTTGDSLPNMVTKPGVRASYFYGWSSDNKKILFTGNRNGAYNIFSIAVNSGKEKQLTELATLADGLEYSADGKYILFNSVRSRTMQLYRRKANRKERTQLTFDAYSNWFPHGSPDQKWIVFIYFPKIIDPSERSFYMHFMLRIMPFEGGTPKIIVHIYGVRVA